ncbi:MAG: hypothetical protein Q7T87_17625 [Polaromonas sp.]|nr:hypothetical protein [Polaromonas sp.]
MTSLPPPLKGLCLTPADSPAVVADAGCDIRVQCERILRCTAESLAASPGGLRFKAGSRPWLDGLGATDVRAAAAAGMPARPLTVTHRPTPKAPSTGAFFQPMNWLLPLPARRA